MFEPQAFAERETVFKGLKNWRGYRLKIYHISRYGDSPDEVLLEDALHDVGDALPQPPLTAARPGAGFVILHQGATHIYLVLCHWDNENELITQVFVHDRQAPESGWRSGGTIYSFCVWDFEVMWHERNSYIAHVLNGSRPAGVEAYLADIKPDF